MNRLVQGGLIRLYQLVKATGALHTPTGRKIFETSYRFYKDRFEAGPIRLLRPWVRPGTFVIDVGANIGFFTRQFATWVGEGGKVIAVEPEALNYSRLQHAVAEAGLTDVVETIQAAVAERSGEGLLEVNPGHPGDHKLGTKGVPITMTTIDELLATRGWPEVSLIKVDVQGAEARVLAGASDAGEVPAGSLSRGGRSAVEAIRLERGELLTSATSQGYTIHSRVGKGISNPLCVDQVLALGESKEYVDMLLLPSQAETANSR